LIQKLLRAAVIYASIGDKIMDFIKSQNSTIRKIGRANNLLVKAAVTTLFPQSFFNALYGSGDPSQEFGDTATISFDCDYSADVEALPELLELLSSYDVKSSFACVGKLIEKYPAEHRLIVENGHEIINHTYTHPPNDETNPEKRFDSLSSNELDDEVAKCHQACKEFLDIEPVGFRVPHFAVQYTDRIYDILASRNYAYSTSMLAVKSPMLSLPCQINGILEFPVSTCPAHPFQAFDTYHAFRSNLTSHRNEEDFFGSLDYLMKFNGEKGWYTNIYLDPLDAVKLKHFGQLLEGIKDNKTRVRTYDDLAMDLSRRTEIA
jgi:peptidoglycan-N-acetylglucosamine deacetylase